MTAVIVKAPNLQDPDDRIEGMILAGEKINTLVKNGTPAKNLFDSTYDGLAATKPSTPMYVRDSADKPISPLKDASGNRQPNKYKYGTKPNQQLHIEPLEDDSGDASKVKKMNFVKPSGNPDMLASGYVGTIAADCEKILGVPPDPAKHDRLKKYLLANVFLSRCH